MRMVLVHLLLKIERICLTRNRTESCPSILIINKRLIIRLALLLQGIEFCSGPDGTPLCSQRMVSISFLRRDCLHFPHKAIPPAGLLRTGFQDLRKPKRIFEEEQKSLCTSKGSALVLRVKERGWADLLNWWVWLAHSNSVKMQCKSALLFPCPGSHFRLRKTRHSPLSNIQGFEAERKESLLYWRFSPFRSRCWAEKHKHMKLEN